MNQEETKEQKLKRLEALREKKARLLKRKPVYECNPGQRLIHESTARERFCFAGNGSGKSCALVWEIYWRCVTGENPYTKQKFPLPCRSLLILDSPEKVEEVFKKELIKWFDISKWVWKKNGKPYHNEIIFPNGSSLSIMFQGMETMKWEGINITGDIFADEPFDREIYVGLMRGAREKVHKARLLMIGTPIGQAWFKTEIYDEWEKGNLKDTDCIRFDSDVNEANLAEGYLEWYFSKLSPAEREVRRHGKFFTVGGAALAHLYNKDLHEIPTMHWEKHWPVVVAVDPHPAKHHHFIIMGRNAENNLIVCKEFPVKGQGEKLTPRQLGVLLRQLLPDYTVQDILCDSLGKTPTTGGDGNKSFIDVLNEELYPINLHVRSTTFDEKNDENFIQKLQQILEIKEQADGTFKPELQIMKSCQGLIGDINNVSWQKVRGSQLYKDKLDIENTDYLACLKYALTTHITYSNRPPKTVKYANPPTVSQKPGVSYNIFKLRKKSVFTKSGKLRR